MAQLEHSYRNQAYKAYRRWGANAKLHVIEQKLRDSLRDQMQHLVPARADGLADRGFEQGIAKQINQLRVACDDLEVADREAHHAKLA